MKDKQQLQELKESVKNFSISISYINKLYLNKKQEGLNYNYLKPYEEAKFSLEKIFGYQIRIIKYMIDKITDEDSFIKDLEYAKKGGYKLFDMDETEKTYDLMSKASSLVDKMNKWDKIQLLNWYKRYTHKKVKKVNNSQKRK